MAWIMRQNFGMNQKMQQRMVMTPMLKKAMKILQLSTLELKEWVEKEMLENPVLEEENEEDLPPSDKDAPTETSDAPSAEQEETGLDPLLEKARQRQDADLVEHLKEGSR